MSTDIGKWLWRSFRGVPSGLVGEENAAAEQVGAGASVHLLFRAHDHPVAVNAGTGIADLLPECRAAKDRGCPSRRNPVRALRLG